MRRRTRRLLGMSVEGAIIALPPYGDEILGLAVGAAIIGAGKNMDDQETSSGYRETRRGRKDKGSDVNRAVAIIIIGCVILLALQVGGLKGLVQH